MIRIVQGFTAYPGGKKRVFVAGEDVSDLPESEVSLYLTKGLAKKADKAGLSKGARRETE